MKHFTPSFLFALSLCSATPAVAQDGVPLNGAGTAFRVDDSGTVVLDPVLELKWQPKGGDLAGSALSSGTTRVSLQLNLASWAGRAGRIYMTLPRTAGPTVRATWRAGGTLMSGSLISGDRAIVYAGRINSPVLRDVIEIQLEADGARLIEPEVLAFGFEIEVEP